MNNFYIPLKNIFVDIERLTTEIDKFVKPNNFQDYGITTSEKMLDNYDFRKYTGVSSPDKNGIRRLKTGEYDWDIVYWPKILENSYMRELSDKFSDLIKINKPRCRMSRLFGSETWNEISYHYDEHTPYRIHIALKTNPNTIWRFRENEKITEIHQPADGIPVLIKTNSVEHSVFIPVGTERMHLWYQYHHEISNEVLEKIKNV